MINFKFNFFGNHPLAHEELLQYCDSRRDLCVASVGDGEVVQASCGCPSRE